MMMMRKIGGRIVALAPYAIGRTPTATPFGNISMWITLLTLVFHLRP